MLRRCFTFTAVWLCVKKIYANINIIRKRGCVVMLYLYLSMVDTKEDNDKFERLYYTYRNIMYSVAHGILKDDMQSENAVSEAFLRIARNFSKISDVDCPQTKGFVVIIVKNIAINIYNKNKKLSSVSLDEAENYIGDARSIEDEVFEKFEADRLKDAINKLKPIYYEVITLFYAQGYSTSEISDMLNINRETVKKRLQRGKAVLIDNLKETEGQL